MRHYRNRRLRIISHEPYPEDMPMPEWARRRELAAAVAPTIFGRPVQKKPPLQPGYPSEEPEQFEEQEYCHNCYHWYAVDENGQRCNCRETELYGEITPGSTPACAYFTESGEDEDDEDVTWEEEGEPTGCRNCSHWSPNGPRDQAASGLCRCEDSAQWRRLKEPTEMCVQFLGITQPQCGTCRYRYARGLPADHDSNPMRCHHIDSRFQGRNIRFDHRACPQYDPRDP